MLQVTGPHTILLHDTVTGNKAVPHTILLHDACYKLQGQTSHNTAT